MHDSFIPTSKCLPKRKKITTCVCSETYVWMVHSSGLCNSQNVETTQMAISRWASKLTVAQPFVAAAVWSISCVWLFCDPRDSSPPGSSVMGFPRQVDWGSGLPFPSPGNLPLPGIEPESPYLCWNDAGIKGNEPLIRATAWMNLSTVMLNERNKPSILKKEYIPYSSIYLKLLKMRVNL